MYYLYYVYLQQKKAVGILPDQLALIPALPSLSHIATRSLHFTYGYAFRYARRYDGANGALR